jgi:hypothetical protein
MPNIDQLWFITERSEALASLMLTSRPDIGVKRETKTDGGVDLVVTVNDADAPSTRLFVVQVKGTLSSNKDDWVENVKQLYKAKSIYLPTCVFIINVRSNEAAYAWVAEPFVKGASASLSLFERPEFRPLDQGAVDCIVNRVRQWYDAIPRTIVATAS